jgi:hypothetical protein
VQVASYRLQVASPETSHPDERSEEVTRCH